MKYKLLISALVCIILASGLEAQTIIYEPPYPNFSNNLIKVGDANPSSISGLFIYDGTSSPIYQVGKTASTPTYRRAYYQWNISDLNIPQAIDIEKIIISFTPTFVNYQTSYLNIFNCELDLSNSSIDLNQLWIKADNIQSTPIAEVQINTPQYSNTLHTFTFNAGTGFVNSFKTAIDNNDMFTIGIAWKYEGPNSVNHSWNTNPISIRVFYTLQQKSVVLDQRLSNGQQAGVLKKWDSGNWSNNIQPGTSLNFPITSTQTILGTQSIISNQKFNNWNGNKVIAQNHNSFDITDLTNTITANLEQTYSTVIIKNILLESPTVNGGSINFKDPWLIDFPDQSYGNSLRNRGMDAPFYNRTSPFNPDFNSSYGGLSYKGVFLDQTPDPNNPTKPYYSVQAISPQDIALSQTGKAHRFYFQNWSGTSVDFQNAGNLSTGVVFHNDNAVVNANFKGTQLSNNVSAYENNSQRKFVRDGNGRLLSVYESNGKVWIEESTNNGQSWTLQNGGNAIGENTQYPSIDYIKQITSGTEQIQNVPIIVFDKWNSYDLSELKIGWLPNNVGNSYMQSAVAQSNPDALVSSPVIATTKGNKFVVVWRGTNTQSQLKLLYRLGEITSSNQCVWLNDVQDLSGSGEFSQNPTIGIKKEIASSVTVHIAWQEGGLNTNSAIYYNTLTINPDNSVTQGTAANISSGSGYTRNYNPSLVAFGEGARICWIGTREVEMQEEESIQWEHRVIFKDPSYWRYWNFVKTNGNTVHSPSINKTDGNTAYIFGWSEDDGNERLFANNSLNNIYTMVGTTGRDLQLSNGASTSAMYVNTFNNYSLPYSFSTTVDINSFYGLQKRGGAGISKGREGIVSKDSVQFYFCMGDISVDGEPIELEELPDTINVNNQGVINQSVISKPFALNDNSTFNYGVEYGAATP